MALLTPTVGGLVFSGNDYNSNLTTIEGALSDLGPLIVSGLAISIGVGLNVAVAAGVAEIGGRVTIAAPFSIAVAPSTTNYIYLLAAGTGTSNTTGVPPTGSLRLGQAVTSGVAVTSVIQTHASGRQLKRRTEDLQLGGGAGQPEAGDLASWHASNTEGNQFRGTLPAGAVPAGSTVTHNALASRPAASHLGNIYIPTDGETTDYDLGSTWAPRGPTFDFTPPVDGDFFWVNQNDASVIVDKNSILLIDPPNVAVTDAHWRFKNAPFAATPPYRVTAYLLSNLLIAKANLMTGMAFRESATGKIISFHWNNGFLWTTKWNTASAIAADYSQPACPVPPNWWRIGDDGTNLNFQVSQDGQYWMQIETRLRANFFTTAPDECGWFCLAGNGGAPNLEVSTRLMSWYESS